MVANVYGCNISGDAEAVTRGGDDPLFLAHIVPGLEQPVRQELGARLRDMVLVRTVERIDERTDLMIVRTTSSPRELLDLRTVEDVFVLAAESTGIPPTRAGTAAIRSLIASGTRLERAVTAALQVRPPRKGKTTFRVIARKAGEHAFRRVDVQRAVEGAVASRFPSWRLVEDDARLEFWVQVVGAQVILGIRLSDNAMRQRTYRRVSLPAALKPTIAAAMVLLSRPEDDDTFLDPLCGSGTILIERALAGRYRLLLGGDRDPEAVRATGDNVGRRYQPIEIRQWDARHLPLADASVTTIATNLPFGKQIGTTAGNRSLYPALLAEWQRLLRPGGRMVLLTSEKTLLRQALERHGGLLVQRQINVLVRGMRAAIFVVSMP